VRRTVLAVASAALLVGCSSGATPSPGPARIDVDTAELRELKAEAGVEDCVPGDAEPAAGGLPDVTLPCLGGGPDVELASLRGPLVVNLWASWCGPCREEMPVIQQFFEQHGERVQVLGIDYEDPQVESAMDLVGETGVTYPLLADPQSSLQGAGPFPGLMGLPMFAFVDEDGAAAVVAQKVDSVGELEDLVDEHLGIRL
jgi:thiol-disulfide isomerase/thioredoxin